MAGVDFNGVVNKAIEYIVESPPLIALVIAGRFMGGVWSYLIFYYYRGNRKGEAATDNFVTKTAMGMVPMVPVAMLLYSLKHGWTFFPEYQKMIELAFPIIIGSALFLLVVFTLTTILMRGK